MRRLLVSFFGLGYLPIAPGTWGSLGAATVFLVLWWTVGVEWWLLVALVAAACIVNVSLGGWAVAHYGSKDPRPVVIDEVAGQWLSLLFVPMTPDNWIWVSSAAFFFFRVFDVIKLPPARQLEALPTGVGILCDDLAAGVQTNLVLQLIFRVLLRA